MDAKVYLGSDHAGFSLKEEIKELLKELGVSCEGLGNHEFRSNDDYPDYAFVVAEKVARVGGYGILICDSGTGMCIVANKIKGVRAANVWNPDMARRSREHNNANVLCLGKEYLTLEGAREIVRVWLTSTMSTEEKHIRRVEKIQRIEEEHLLLPFEQTKL
jgi:ribose 5-phosphate isomerase B